VGMFGGSDARLPKVPIARPERRHRYSVEADCSVIWLGARTRVELIVSRPEMSENALPACVATPDDMALRPAPGQRAVNHDSGEGNRRSDAQLTGSENSRTGRQSESPP